jgi:methyltransferase (TIGR00027 family)
MGQTEPLIRHISDTARWVAVYRARETERPDALFHDPFARRLAGALGEQIAGKMAYRSQKESWPFVMRTYLFDELIANQVQQGTNMVINLGAGLDARPYRMALPASLQWIEVDLPEILAYKEEILRNDKPVCRLERVRLDLANIGARRELFARLAGQATKALIITEGVIGYLSADEVGALAQDLATPTSLQNWVLDLGSPGLLRMLQKKMPEPGQAGSPLKFGPAEGPGFFTRYGWDPIEVRSILKSAARAQRLPFFMRIMALLPESSGAQGSRPWSGICLLAKQKQHGI